jgi:hypothetical protein
MSDQTNTNMSKAPVVKFTLDMTEYDDALLLAKSEGFKTVSGFVAAMTRKRLAERVKA